MYHSVSLLRDFFALLPEGEADAQCHKMNYFDPAPQVTILALERGTGSTDKKVLHYTIFHYDKDIFL